MKKLLIASLLYISAFSFAQFNLQLENTRFGLIGGPDYSRVQNAHNPSAARIAFYAGGLAIIPFDNDDMFYIQPQLEYLSAGEKGAGTTVYANNYISVPIYFKGYFSEAESEFFGMFGPRFAFLVNQKTTAPSRAIYAGPEGKANMFNFALSGGLGFSYKRKIELTLRYDIGLSDTYPKLDESATTGDANSAKRKSEQILSAGISYIFD